MYSSQGSQAERSKARDEFDAAWAALPSDIQQKLGHQKDVQIIDCLFDGESCSERYININSAMFRKIQIINRSYCK